MSLLICRSCFRSSLSPRAALPEDFQFRRTNTATPRDLGRRANLTCILNCSCRSRRASDSSCRSRPLGSSSWSSLAIASRSIAHRSIADGPPVMPYLHHRFLRTLACSMQVQEPRRSCGSHCCWYCSVTLSRQSSSMPLPFTPAQLTGSRSSRPGCRRCGGYRTTVRPRAYG